MLKKVRGRRKYAQSRRPQTSRVSGRIRERANSNRNVGALFNQIHVGLAADQLELHKGLGFEEFWHQRRQKMVQAGGGRIDPDQACRL